MGEYERAFYGDQLLYLAPVFEAHGVELWLPEVHGQLDLGDASHQALIMLLGAQSRREVLRARWRALHAMRAAHLRVDPRLHSGGVRCGRGGWRRRRP